MPKLENFDTYFKIDNRRIARNTAEYEPFGNLIRVYRYTSPNILAEAEYQEWTDSTDTPYASLSLLEADLNAFMFSSETPVGSSSVVSTSNSTTTLLTSGSTFTGSWELAGQYNSITVSAKTDQDGSFAVEFSPDGINIDSTLTRYYRTNQIEAPHKFTITRNYLRVTFTNSSASDQTFLRLQTILGSKDQLNTPLDSTLAQDFDAIATRPYDYHTEVALGKRQGHTTWNKFG